MQTQYLSVLTFFIIGMTFFPILLGISSLVRDRGVKKDTTPYECGMSAEETPWVSPAIRFTIFALLFVLFDVEALFVFPWAVSFFELGMAGFVAVVVFSAVLFLGLIYAWKKDALKWE
jgi:NADH-quinone oxidoreductase subunit A